ncbi:MAG: hypothetical protein PF487_03410 [Bacteroidales bacterium]|nr:hypothetical protein [Bacteroidales bacterium]
MNGLIPMTTFFAYCYISKIKYQFRVLNIIFIGFYIFFIYAYFSRLSGLLIRTNNLDDIFEMSSSNSIAISLNILLYIYIILSYYKKDIYENRFIFIFAIINFVLIVIQQSRIGVVVALVNIIIILLIKKWLSYKRIFYLSLFFITFSLGYSYLDTYTHITGEIGLEAYKEDSRGVIQRSFFENITKDNFFYGYPIDQVYYKNQTRVFNVFLRMWNLYTILGFIIIAILLLRRIFNYKKYYFPLIFIVPFILYGMVEEPFFPYYWDFAIYLLLFTRKNQFDASYSMLNK